MDYTSGTLHKRYKYTTHAPDSKYGRFGGFGLLNQRNLSAMNRQAFEKCNASFWLVGFSAFEAAQIESTGRPELMAAKFAKRVKEALNQLAKKEEP